MKKIDVVGYKCTSCGKLHFPFHDRCLACKGREFEPAPFEGQARLVTYTQIFNLPWGFDERFLIIGVAEFDNGLKAMGQVKAESIEGLKPGMTVTPSWEPVRVQYGEKVYGFKFTP